jgi:hypothetical protein
MSKVHFTYKLYDDVEWAEFPPCPYCGEDAVDISEDWGWEPEDGFCGYDVDCTACGQALGHISYAKDIEALVKDWPKTRTESGADDTGN